MKKILLVSYYGFKDSLKCASESLEKLGYEVDTYPLFRYAFDSHDKKPNYKEHFNSYVQESSPDIILWWFFYVPTEVVSFIHTNNPRCYSILFNWDDPYTWFDKHNQIKDKCPYFDLVVATCEETLSNYITNGAKDAIFSPPGFDPKINYPLNDNKYTCDVSICCTNLYEDLNSYSDQYINRKELIDLLASQKEFSFHLYGPEFLKYRYPDNYKGFVQYNDLNDIYNKSRINISTHVCCSKNKYINERTVLILGSGGLLMVDPVKGMDSLISKEECVYIDKENIISQIKDILAKYERSEKERSENNTMKEKAQLKSLQYTWDSWARKLHQKISLHFFDDLFYRQLYIIPENIVNLREYWTKEGVNQNQVPFKFEVPKTFDYPQYSMDTKWSETKLIDKNVSKEYLFWHYRVNSRSSRYKLQFDSKKNFDIKQILDDCKIDPGCWFEVNNKFRAITRREDIDNNLLYLETINKQYPYSDINVLLSLYFDIVEK